VRQALPLVAVALALAACGGAVQKTATPAGATFVSAPGIRSPYFRKTMDANPANLASADVTHAFGQLPVYIDDAKRRLLPLDMFRAFEPGRTLTRTYRVTTPRTQLILDTVVASGQTQAEARTNAHPYGVAVTLDGRTVPEIDRYWVYYRNNGPQICRIYFPNDLSSLNMAVHSLVVEPLAGGHHRISVTVTRRSPGERPARRVTTYLLWVLPRRPTAAERAIAPGDDAPKPTSRTPLTFVTNH
jgi:hypothetical protein